MSDRLEELKREAATAVDTWAEPLGSALKATSTGRWETGARPRCCSNRYPADLRRQPCPRAPLGARLAGSARRGTTPCGLCADEPRLGDAFQFDWIPPRFPGSGGSYGARDHLRDAVSPGRPGTARI